MRLMVRKVVMQGVVHSWSRYTFNGQEGGDAGSGALLEKVYV